ncbi:MAG: DUF362 domain-containing protein [Bacteroidales bacterium]|nr:DUF362 domain-containing protein [Bacteroidales bacterium]MBN2820411.1 DUF362 domain-containing protein [Bacteroidales bacterium]
MKNLFKKIDFSKGFRDKQPKKGFYGKISFIILGILATIWFLIRVIPKPSRAAYPCMRAAAPIVSSFVVYLLGVIGFSLFLKKVRYNLLKSKYAYTLLFVFGMIVTGTLTIVFTNSTVKAIELADEQVANDPVGDAKGVFPGRVVWLHDTDATDANCSNSEDDYWSNNANTNQDVVSAMVSEGLRKLTGAANDAAAWDSIFTYYNRTHGKGSVGYTSGEKIAIKINLNGLNNGWGGSEKMNINTSPQVSYAILDQLVNKAGVAQANIHLGDPNVPMQSTSFDHLAGDFPNVKYWGYEVDMVMAEASAKVFKASDGHRQYAIPQSYIEASYLINIPVLKKHHRAGISVCSKNHFGSLGAFDGGAWNLHPSLPSPDASGTATNGDYGVYRCFVDIMGHEHMGGKTVLYLVDGLWGSTNWGHPPVKWEMTPFNNDYPNSLFLSLDPVAIESVCYDFLAFEFDNDHPTEGLDVMSDDKGPFPQFAGTDDFLIQAADVSARPASITYDPEDDGTELGSLGTHEHWNNATDKKYSRNLDPVSGTGIELNYVNGVVSNKEVFNENSLRVYPNPVSDMLNISCQVFTAGTIDVQILSIDGKLLYENRFEASGDSFRQSIPVSNLNSNMYVLTLKTNEGIYSRSFVKSE